MPRKLRAARCRVSGDDIIAARECARRASEDLIVAARKPPGSRSGVASAFEDTPPPALPERMQDRYGDPIAPGAPPTSSDVIELKDALRAAGVREHQMMTLTRLQLESQAKLTASVDKLGERQEQVTASINRLSDTAGSLEKAITQLGELLGSSTAPVTRGALAATDVTPGGRKVKR